MKWFKKKIEEKEKLTENGIDKRLNSILTSIEYFNAELKSFKLSYDLFLQQRKTINDLKTGNVVFIKENREKNK
jgi:cytochrome c peroxidase